MRQMNKTKQERQRWWFNLTPKQQVDYIEKLVDKKKIKRHKEALRTMRKYGDKFSCTTCFHRKIRSCEDDLPCGCGYWYSPTAKKQGPLLEKQKSKNLVG